MNAAKRPVTTSLPYSQDQPFRSPLPRSQTSATQRLSGQNFSRQNSSHQNPNHQDPNHQALDLTASETRSASQIAARPKRISYSGARQAIAFESSVKLTVNLLLAIVAATTIAKLIPYYQSQQGRLATLQASVQVAERNNAELRSQFNRNFDPAQASRIMQEQSGMSYPNQKKVIWQASPENSPENSPESISENAPQSTPTSP
jgi:hypothetical protein